MRRSRFTQVQIIGCLRKAEAGVNVPEQAVRKRRGRKRLKLERVPLHRCEAINEVWSMDFVSDSLAHA